MITIGITTVSDHFIGFHMINPMNYMKQWLVTNGVSMKGDFIIPKQRPSFHCLWYISSVPVFGY